MNYCYKAKIVRVYDGDTIFVEIRKDVGFGIEIILKGSNGKGEALRLFGINSPELRGKSKEAGIRSRDALRKMLPIGTEIEIQTVKGHKRGKFGRYLATAYLNGKSINDWMVTNGYAEHKTY